MDLMQQRAVQRAREALALASQDAGAVSRDSARNAEHVADLVRAMVADKEIPWAAQRENDALRERGHIAEHGGVLVPFHRLYGPHFRDLITGSATGTAKAGYLIGTDVGPYVSELLHGPSVLRAGATVLTDLQGDTMLPTQATSGDAEWLTDETDAPTEAAPTFSSVTLTPKTTSAFVDISRLLRRQSAHDVESLMRSHLQRAVARAIDTAALVGTGSNGQPTGLKNVSGVNSYAISTNGGALSRAHIRGMVKACADDQAIQPDSRLAFLVNPTTALSCYATETSTGSGRYLYEPDGPTTGTLGGWPCFMNGAPPSNGSKGSGSSLSTAFFGDWAQLYVGLFGGGVELLVNPYALGTAGATRLHIYLSCDVGVAQPTAFCMASDIVTTG